jgi:polysaccharide deacetylase 2 family uncharacterized protein YibQ
MKKPKWTRKLKVLFWLVFAVGLLWVFYAPHTHRASLSPRTVITVKVAQSPPPSLRQDDPPPTRQQEDFEEPPSPQKQQGSITVPVSPEPVAPLPAGQPVRIALVIDDMGADMRSSEKAILLPQSVTLSFLPFAPRTREQAKIARERGHEVLLHMPMEPRGHESPGNGALMVDLPLAELQARLETALASFTGFDGINNHMGSKFTAYAEGMEMVIDALKERNLFFLDSRTSGQTVGLKIAQAKGLPAISRDVFLDDDPSPAAVRRQLETAERVARRKGRAVAIGHPHHATIDAIEAWVPGATARGIELVPVNHLVGQP